jgi:hypothetical protein
MAIFSLVKNPGIHLIGRWVGSSEIILMFSSTEIIRDAGGIRTLIIQHVA